MYKTLSFLAGIVCGLIVGAVSALLLAPVSGNELQSRTRRWLSAAIDEARQAALAKRVELDEQFAALKRGETPQSE